MIRIGVAVPYTLLGCVGSMQQGQMVVEWCTAAAEGVQPWRCPLEIDVFTPRVPITEHIRVTGGCGVRMGHVCSRHGTLGWRVSVTYLLPMSGVLPRSVWV